MFASIRTTFRLKALDFKLGIVPLGFLTFIRHDKFGWTSISINIREHQTALHTTAVSTIDFICAFISPDGTPTEHKD